MGGGRQCARAPRRGCAELSRVPCACGVEENAVGVGLSTPPWKDRTGILRLAADPRRHPRPSSAALARLLSSLFAVRIHLSIVMLALTWCRRHLEAACSRAAAPSIDSCSCTSVVPSATSETRLSPGRNVRDGGVIGGCQEGDAEADSTCLTGAPGVFCCVSKCDSTRWPCCQADITQRPMPLRHCCPCQSTRLHSG